MAKKHTQTVYEWWIQPFAIPDTEEKMIISLFTDDTNLYLSKEDRMDLVQEILDRWCQAFSVKFNMEKMEIIPFRTEAHRERVIATRKLNLRDQIPFDDHIKIARDSKTIRILSAQFRNHSSEEILWESVIDKI